MAKTPIKADINFEQELWKAANELVEPVAENQYKDYILFPETCQSDMRLYDELLI
jgi:hypothetical protein